MLELVGVTASYGAVQALRGVDLRVDQGQAVVIVGPNGAGKSTLLRSIMGMHKNVGGEMFFEGRSLRGVPAHVRLKRGLAWIPEGRGIVPELSVEENLDLAQFSPRWKPELRTRSLDRFPVLARARKRRAGSRSGGEQQMLAIARAWATAPSLLLVDEPSLGLAPIMVDSIVDILRGLRAAGTAMLLVEQRARGVLELADQAALKGAGLVRATDRSELNVAELSFNENLGLSHGDG